MKTVVSKLLKCAALVLAMGGWTVVRAESPTNDVMKVSPPALIRSVFFADTGAGKDPFYPNSKRRLEVIEQSIATNSVPQPNSFFQYLSLKGISGAKGQRLALINSSTLGVGEMAEIRCGVQLVKVRCVEIRDRSVIIELNGLGEQKELKLRDGI
jgi:hypothetical protein